VRTIIFEKNARYYLKTHKALKVGYDAFIKSGGGTLEELQDYLATTRQLPSLAQGDGRAEPIIGLSAFPNSLLRKPEKFTAP
jgi:hypothetical protein